MVSSDFELKQQKRTFERVRFFVTQTCAKLQTVIVSLPLLNQTIKEKSGRPLGCG
jgi:hypothetical protein